MERCAELDRASSCTRLRANATPPAPNTSAAITAIARSTRPRRDIAARGGAAPSLRCPAVPSDRRTRRPAADRGGEVEGRTQARRGDGRVLATVKYAPSNRAARRLSGAEPPQPDNACDRHRIEEREGEVASVMLRPSSAPALSFVSGRNSK